LEEGDAYLVEEVSSRVDLQYVIPNYFASLGELDHGQ
jgi:hypothetical protein